MKRLFIALLGGVLCQYSYGALKLPFEGNLRYDEVCHLTSHNSYAAVEHGYVYAQQQLSIEKQLALGVRGLMLDICEDKKKVFLVHGGPFMTRLICRGKEPELFSSALRTIKTFLEQNPEEILTIFLENYVKSSDLLDQEFISGELKEYILSPDIWDPAQGWPTFEWMRVNNKRLVIFNALGTTTLCFNEWEHVIENQWGTLHPVRACRERPESKKYTDRNRSLYLVNYFPMFNLSFDNSYQRINTENLATFMNRLLKHGLDTGSQKELLPTFVCLDYVNIGNGIMHVDHINKLKEKNGTNTTIL